MSKLLTEADFERAAETLGCDVPAIKAVCEVEAPGGGFLSDGIAPRILFEAHIFSDRTNHQFDASHPNISSRSWNQALYAKGPNADARGFAEHKRLVQAVALDRDAALQSASWGKFQHMGFNWKVSGNPSLQEFINAMYSSEGAHLDAFIGYVRGNRLDRALREHRWAAFALGYNGESYAENQYDTKLAAAWVKWGGV